jgi:hypothetical protein
MGTQNSNSRTSGLVSPFTPSAASLC